MDQPTQEKFEEWKQAHGDEHPSNTITEDAWYFLCELWFRDFKEYKFFCCCGKRIEGVTGLHCTPKVITHIDCWKEEFEDKKKQEMWPQCDWKQGKLDLMQVYSAVEDFVKRGNTFLPEEKPSRASLVVADITRGVLP